MIKFGKRKIIVIMLFGILSVLQAGALPAVTDILLKLDELQEMESDVTAKVKITQQRVDQGVKIMESIYYRRDSDDAFLIVMTSPDSDKGDGYLRVGDNMWMYLRNTRTFQHMNRDESISGSDMSAEDMEERKYSELYEPALDEDGNEIISERTLGNGKIEVYCFELIAKVNDVKYPKQVFWVTKGTMLTVKTESYSVSGNLMRTSYYKQYTEIDGRFIPLWQMFIDQFEIGNKSLIELSAISLINISDSIFTKEYLENLSR